jgi:hypothetical protein
VPTGEGWLFLASVLDLGSRRLLGYSMADHMRSELVLDALGMAVAARGGDHAVHGVIVHADRGSQYTSNDYLDYCQAQGRQLRPSVGRTGVCWDKALVILQLAGYLTLLDRLLPNVDVVPLKRPIPPSIFPTLSPSPGCTTQELIVNPPVGGVYGYWCTPPFSQLKRLGCKCRDREEEKEEQAERAAEPAAQRARRRARTAAERGVEPGAEPVPAGPPVVTTFIPEVRPLLPSIVAAMPASVMSSAFPEESWVLAPWSLFEPMVIAPWEARFLERYQPRNPLLDPRVNPVMGYRNLYMTLGLFFLVVEAGVITVGPWVAELAGGAVVASAAAPAEAAAAGWIASAFATASRPALAGAVLAVVVATPAFAETGGMAVQDVDAVRVLPTEAVAPRRDEPVRLGTEVSVDGRRYYVVARVSTRPDAVDVLRP